MNEEYDYNATYFDAFDILNLKKEYYLNSKKYTDLLPWDLIDFGVDKEYLIAENEKSKTNGTTRDCKQGCNGCGLAKMGVCKNGNN